MKKLEQLLEDAYKNIENEDGTMADLGIIPTGHKFNKKVDIENVEDSESSRDIG